MNYDFNNTGFTSDPISGNNFSKYKFSKIENFSGFEPEILVDKDSIFFFDNKGSIINFNKLSKLKWKKNYYSKSERKKNPVLFFSNNKINKNHEGKYVYPSGKEIQRIPDDDKIHVIQENENDQ